MAALQVAPVWTEKQFENVKRKVMMTKYSINGFNGDLEGLKKFLSGKRNFVAQMLANPVLGEHEFFTGLLWAVFHLEEELRLRDSLLLLPQKDKDHLNNDLRRVYDNLLIQWIDYLAHLQMNYPYLFSLAVRTNPFNKSSSVVIQ
jgi:hypothetical protein